MKNLPAKKNELTRSKQAVTDRLAHMRKEAGLTDHRVLHFTCSATGKPFAIGFKRLSEAHRFQIESIEARTGNTGLLSRLFGKDEPPAQSFAAGSFDFAGFACPHCGHRQSANIADFFQCYCDRLLCGARISVMNGVTRFACHNACGRTGVLGMAIDSFAGSESAGNSLTGPIGAKRLSAPVKKLPRN